MDLIGNMFPIPDKEIEKYINRILEDFKDEQFGDLQPTNTLTKTKLNIRL
jgi:type III restriction enzyme